MMRISHLLLLSRHRAGLRLGQVAFAIGYKNVNKGCRLIESLERGERHDMPLARRLCELYGVPETDLLETERIDDTARLAAFEAWVNVPQPPRMVVRVIAAIYLTVPFPDSLSDHAALEAHACEYSRRNKKRVCLELNRRHTVSTDETGEVVARTEATPNGFSGAPTTTFGGKPLPLDTMLKRDDSAG